MRAATNVSVAGGCHRPRLTLRYVVLGGLFAYVAARDPTTSWALLFRFLFASLPIHSGSHLCGPAGSKAVPTVGRCTAGIGPCRAGRADRLRSSLASAIQMELGPLLGVSA